MGPISPRSPTPRIGLTHLVDRRLLCESIDEHSLLTVYEWIADRAEGLEILVIGTADGEGPAKLARRADLVFVYERAKDIVADASYRHGHVSNLYFSAGGPSDALREAENFDIIVALESAMPRSFIRQLAQQTGAGGRSQVVITRKTRAELDAVLNDRAMRVVLEAVKALRKIPRPDGDWRGSSVTGCSPDTRRA